jgi:alpha-L-fucosidase
VNGEAIHGTRPFAVFGEGPTAVVEGPFADTKRRAFTSRDVRFTVRDRTVYAILLAWPETGRATVRSLAKGKGHLREELARVDLLGASQAVKWTRDAEGLHVDLSGARPARYAAVLRLTPQGGTAR